MKDYTKHGEEKQFRAVEIDGEWVVIDVRTIVARGYLTAAQAGNAAGAMNKKARRASKCTMRACMTCRAEFESEGIHNRICLTCRHAASLDPYAVGIGSGLRRRG